MPPWVSWQTTEHAHSFCCLASLTLGVTSYMNARHNISFKKKINPEILLSYVLKEPCFHSWGNPSCRKLCLLHSSTFRYALKNFSLLICEQRSAKKPWSWEFKSCFSCSDQWAAYNLGLKPLPLLVNICLFCEIAEIAMRLSLGWQNMGFSIGNLKCVCNFGKKWCFYHKTKEGSLRNRWKPTINKIILFL